jgi:hypothetical protein
MPVGCAYGCTVFSGRKITAVCDPALGVGWVWTINQSCTGGGLTEQPPVRVR